MNIIINANILTAKIPDIHALFYVGDDFSHWALLLVIQILLTAVVVLFVVNSLFSRMEQDRKVGYLEALAIEKLVVPDEYSAVRKVNENLFKISMIENNLILGGRKIEHGGLYLLECQSTAPLSLAIVRLVEKIVEQWKRPVIYQGREESALMEPLLESEEERKNEIRRAQNVLKGYLFKMPAILPTSENIFRIACRMSPGVPPGALIMEDMDFPLMKQWILRPGTLEELKKISMIMNLPVFLIGKIRDKGCLGEIINNPHLLEKFGFHGEIRAGKDREIHIISKTREMDKIISG